MISVNPYFITDLLSPITGLADDDEAVEQYKYIDTTNDIYYREIIRNEIRMYYNCLNSVKKEKVKRALNYYLATSEIDFERVFESCLPPFDPPKDARDFFVWIWEEFYGGEVYEVPNKAIYVINSDVNEPNRSS
ncbi:hypothetical protein [Paenibacillus agilis]|uniref:Uncharacterized protein n=1 Tax=Paenibacillus agilis TaxID=3020863 RepID=A0A559IXZ5_9BACL|nr:hypothetical protein [Paenibacillus agilis]TVX92498.1 hypothetical protein FPZ44_05175 [Paenibacillus agilis]